VKPALERRRTSSFHGIAADPVDRERPRTSTCLVTWLVNLSFDSLRLGSRIGYVFALPVEPFQKMMRMWRREITAVTVLSTPVMIS
jgi:hypothetical protein